MSDQDYLRKLHLQACDETAKAYREFEQARITLSQAETRQREAYRRWKDAEGRIPRAGEFLGG